MGGKQKRKINLIKFYYILYNKMPTKIRRCKKGVNKTQRRKDGKKSCRKICKKGSMKSGRRCVKKDKIKRGKKIKNLSKLVKITSFRPN